VREEKSHKDSTLYVHIDVLKAAIEKKSHPFKKWPHLEDSSFSM
jgi:hypothetical protein